jgi:hypothetical protein
MHAQGRQQQFQARWAYRSARVVAREKGPPPSCVGDGDGFQLANGGDISPSRCAARRPYESKNLNAVVQPHSFSKSRQESDPSLAKSKTSKIEKFRPESAACVFFCNFFRFGIEFRVTFFCFAMKLSPQVGRGGVGATKNRQQWWSGCCSPHSTQK